MFKNLISHRKEDACIYLQCGYTNKIISNFYYKEATVCEEIIGLSYFGPIINEECKSSNMINLSLESFLTFLQELRNCYYLEGKHNINIENINEIINIYKKDENYTIIRATKNKKLADKNIWAWEVAIRRAELAEYLEELEKIKRVITEARENVEANN
jgi:hypothetical protein